MKDKTWITIPSMSGVEGESSITFIGATFSTKDSSNKGYPDPDFGDWLITEIYDRLKILALKKGLFKHKYVCPACGTELNIETKRPIQTEHQLQLKEFPPFKIRITLPSVECPNCRKICGIDIDGKTSYHLNEAMIHAMDSENIKPY